MDSVRPHVSGLRGDHMIGGRYMIDRNLALPRGTTPARPTMSSKPSRYLGFGPRRLNL